MMIRKQLASFALGALLAGCSSPAPSTSSSSHWVTCQELDDCSALANAAACTSGYCVDSSGTRLSASSLTEADAGGGSSGPCDPLAPKMLPVELGTVLGVGTAPDGTTYMADEVTSPSTVDRVFVSQGEELVRTRVVGSGSENGTDYSFSFDAGNGPESLLIQMRDGKTTAMGLGYGGKGFIDDPGAVKTALSVKDPAVIDGFTLKNLPGDVAIEYVADVIDGTVIVVTHPADDYSYDDFRLFEGTTDALVERRVINVSRSRSGDTRIQFYAGPSSGGPVMTASFTYVLEPADDGGTISHPGPGTLMGVGTPGIFTQRWPTPSALPGFSFSCL